MSVVGELFLEFALLSFVAFGGATALLPEMHRVVVENHHWLDDHHLHPPLRHRPSGARAERAGGDADRLGESPACSGALVVDVGHVPADERPDLSADRPLGEFFRQALAEGRSALAWRRWPSGLVFSGATLIAQVSRVSAGRPGCWSAATVVAQPADEAGIRCGSSPIGAGYWACSASV